MATNRTSEGLVSLLTASGLGWDSQLTGIADQLQQQQSINDSLMQQTIAAMTQPVSDAGGGVSGSSILSTIGGVLGGGLGIAPLISGLAGLCGGGGDESVLAGLPNYMAPLPIHIDAGFSEGGGGVYGVDTAQGGAPRAMTSSPAAHITVQVQAMDSSSFLDHSQDIALAVRQAMLQSTVLNDVIRDV